MYYTFNNIEGYRCNSKLSKINRKNILQGRNNVKNATPTGIAQSLVGWLYLLTAPTGLGKTYIMAACAIDELIEISKNCYMPNVEKVINQLQIFCTWVSKITGFETTKHDPAKIAKKILKQIENGKLWNNNKSTYRLFMHKITEKAKDINNIIQESTVKDDVKKHVKQMYNKIANYADVDKQNIKRKPIIVITDTKDNVKGFYDEVHKLIEKDSRLNDFQKSFLKSQTLYLEANTDQIDKLLDTTITQVVSDYFDENKQLNNLLNQCKESKKINKIFNSSKTNKDFKTSCTNLNYELLNSYRNLCKKYKDNNQEVPITLVKNVIEIFPATNFVNFDASIVFMTTAKYLKLITHTAGRFSFQHEYQQHMLIIDEFDKQEKVFAENIIKGNAYKIVQGFGTVYKSVLSSNLKNTQDYKGVKEIIQPAIDRIKEIAQGDFPINFKWDVDGNLTSNEPIQLCSTDIGSTLVVNGKIRNKDDNNQTDWVDAKPATAEQHHHLLTCKEIDKKEIQNNQSQFPNVIIERGSAYLYFLSCLKKAAYKIYNNVKNIDPKRASLIEAVNILIDYYDIHGIKDDVKSYFYKNSFKNNRLATNHITDKGFHNSGFNYLLVGACTDSVEFEDYDISMSATGALMQIVNAGAEVIGISATADAKTVLHNFDICWLKENLSKRFIEISTENKQQINEEYKNKRNYKGNGIKINIGFVRPNKTELLNIFDNDIAVMQANIKATVENIPDNEVEGMVNYRIEQLSRLTQSIDKFINADNTRYMLCLCSRNIGKHAKEEEIIEKAIKQYAKEKEAEIFIYYINAEAMRQGVFDKAREKLEKSIANKVIIISSYSSFGAGKNPQYEFTEQELANLINVDNDGINPIKNTDIDSLYLDSPTSLFPASDSKEKYMDTITKLTFMYYLMCLKETGVVQFKKIKYFIKQALVSGLRNNRINYFRTAYKSASMYETFGNSRDYIEAVIKYIEQAVGRMARCAFKRKNINIFADYKLAEILAEDARGNELMTHEYSALRKEAKIFCKNNTEKLNLSFPTETEKLQDIAHYSNKKIYKYLMNLLAEINNVAIEVFTNIVNKIENSANISYEIIIDILSGLYTKLNAKDSKFISELLRVTRNCEKSTNTNIDIVATKVLEKIKQKIIDSNNEHDKFVKKWFEFRDFVLKHPTLNSLESVPAEFKDAYIKIPEEFRNKKNSNYKYKGNSDTKNGIDKYEFFDGFSSSQLVSADATSLPLIISNTLVKQHFVSQGYAISWQSNEYMLAPIVFTNFYRPAIAEQACKALFSEYFEWQEMPQKLTEKFDAILIDRSTGKKALLDVKFWTTSREHKIGTSDKIKKVIAITEIDRVVYANILGVNNCSKIEYLNLYFKKTTDMNKEIIMLIPEIIDSTAKVISKNIRKMKSFINN